VFVPLPTGVESPFSRPGGHPLNLDLLAIAAHPDDVELTCGGTLLKMAQLGYKTGILDLTAGEMGTRGSPKIRAKEATADRGRSLSPIQNPLFHGLCRGAADLCRGHF